MIIEDRLVVVKRRDILELSTQVRHGISFFGAYVVLGRGIAWVRADVLRIEPDPLDALHDRLPALLELLEEKINVAHNYEFGGRDDSN